MQLFVLQLSQAESKLVIMTVSQQGQTVTPLFLETHHIFELHLMHVC